MRKYPQTFDCFLQDSKGGQMKNEKHKKRLGLFVLFLEFFGILFVGFCICNAMAVAIDCMFEGFGSFWGRILDLPFLLYLCFSFVISIVLTIVMQNKTR